LPVRLSSLSAAKGEVRRDVEGKGGNPEQNRSIFPQPFSQNLDSRNKTGAQGTNKWVPAM
jgi:hypothetical protein